MIHDPGDISPGFNYLQERPTGYYHSLFPVWIIMESNWDMGMIDIQYLNLRQIAESGQCFRWIRLDPDVAIKKYGVPEDVVRDSIAMHKSDKGDKCGDIYVIPPFGADYRDFAPLIMVDLGDRFWSSASDVDWNGHWRHYFDLDTDYADVERKIRTSEDKHALKCFEYGSGIRILRQDTWEMILTFLISQNNNITRITRSVEEICRRHVSICGSPAGCREGAAEGGRSVYLFPRPEEFDRSILSDRSLGLGYRAPYIDGVVGEFIKNPALLTELELMNYEDAYDTLLGFTGIGPKVANCICLFGLHHIEAFPIDTHVKQLLIKYYPEGFPYDKYKGVAGIVQQYLFYYELKNKI